MRIAFAAAWIAVMLSASQVARADPIRILVAASHARGEGGEAPLHHSTEDADHVREVLTTLGGVGPDAAIRLVDPTVAQLAAAFDRARAIAATHAPSEVTFFFYFSGHGDRDRIHLGGESLAMTELLDRVRAVPAGLRIVVTDACRNDPTRPKGFDTEPAFTLAGGGPASDGVVALAASEAGEAAQESDQLQGALFTHYWVSGLRGAADANGDGRVTLAESYDYAYSQTLFRSARGSGVLQHPTATIAVSELSPIVLTQTFGGATRFELPQSADTRYLVYAVGSHSVLGEIWSGADRRVVFAVPAGHYIVERRAAGGGTAAAEVALARGDDRVLTPADFQAVPEEQMASKGGDVVLHPNELTIELGGGTSRLADGLATVGLRYAYVLDAWAFSLEPHAALGFQRTAASDVTVDSLGIQASIERRWRLGGPVVAFGLGGAADIVWQRVQRTDAAEVALAGYPTTGFFSGVAVGPVALARLRVPVSSRTWLEAAVIGELLFANFEGSLGVDGAVTGSVGAGLSF